MLLIPLTPTGSLLAVGQKFRIGIKSELYHFTSDNIQYPKTASNECILSNKACLTVACGADGMMTGTIRPDVFGLDSSDVISADAVRLNSGTCEDKIEVNQNVFELSTELTACDGTITEDASKE